MQNKLAAGSVVNNDLVGAGARSPIAPIVDLVAHLLQLSHDFGTDTVLDIQVVADTRSIDSFLSFLAEQNDVQDRLCNRRDDGGLLPVLGNGLQHYIQHFRPSPGFFTASAEFQLSVSAAERISAAGNLWFAFADLYSDPLPEGCENAQVGRLRDLSGPSSDCAAV